MKQNKINCNYKLYDVVLLSDVLHLEGNSSTDAHIKS